MLLAAVSLSASTYWPRNKTVFYYELEAPLDSTITYRFIDMAEEKNEISEYEIESPETTTLADELYRLQVISNYPLARTLTLTFPAFYCSDVTEYLGYSLRMKNGDSSSDYEIEGNSTGKAVIQLVGTFGPDVSDAGTEVEYLYSFGYSFDLSGATGGHYVSNVLLEVTENE